MSEGGPPYNKFPDGCKVYGMASDSSMLDVWLSGNESTTALRFLFG
jgi:hypothetical protein